MTREYFLFYIEASVACILIFAMLLHHDMTTATRSERQVQYDNTLIAFILYFISDSFWAGVSSGRIPRTQLSVSLPNLANVLVISVVSYQWLRYVAAAEQMPRRNERWVQVLMRLPLEIVSGILIIWWAIAPDFWVSPSGELNELYYVMLFLASVIYVLGTFVYSTVQAVKQKNRALRRRYAVIGMFPLLIVLFGLLQIYWLNAPVFCMGCTLVMLFYFLQEVKDQISIDALTGLNNRGQLMRYEAQEEGGRREGAPIYVMMLDANDFKRINDTFGHAEGDRALILIAQTLKESVAGMAPPPFLGRYGGDEFVLVVHTDSEATLDGLVERINRGLREKSGQSALPYSLTVSVGYASMIQGRDTFQWCLEQADERLYQNKAKAKRGR